MDRELEHAEERFAGVVEEGPAQMELRVVAFSRSRDWARARRAIREARRSRQAVITVASPAVYNQPRFRAAIEAEQVDILVETPEQFRREQLEPWVGSAVQKAKRIDGEDAPPSEDHDELDISARVRDAETGRLDARKLSDLLGMQMKDIAEHVCGITKQALGQRPTSANIQGKLQPLEEIATLLRWCGGDEAKLKAWLHRPNKDFVMINGRRPSPLDLILAGHAPLVAAKAQNLLRGIPA